MHRTEVIQALIDQRAQGRSQVNYLEIGVFRGSVLLNIRASRKIAVDPQFRIRPVTRAVSLLKNPGNLKNQYFEMTSDEFFNNHSDALNAGIDVAFVDGLHTYQQSYKDVQNCLKYLNDGGVIVMHDCDPPSASAAVSEDRTKSDPNSEISRPTDHVWTGDVFKALIRLRTESDDLNIFVLDCDFGLGIVTRGVPEAPLNFSLQELETTTFADFRQRREELLNLKPVSYFPEWLQRAA